jgi:predicted RNA-binding protein with TRAM domain
MRKKKNPVLTGVQVESYAAGGKSIARVDGKAVFIEGAVPGDVVDVRLSPLAMGAIVRVPGLGAGAAGFGEEVTF